MKKIPVPNYYANGYNCAKSVYLTICKKTNRKPNNALLKACTLFGGGMGKTGGVCGALIGAQLALSNYFGTVGIDRADSNGYLASAKMATTFRATFGHRNCIDLIHGNFGSTDQKRKCGNIVETTVEIALKIIEEMGG